MIAACDMRVAMSIRPCPQIQPGPGRVVLMKSTTRYMGAMAKLKLVGSSEAIQGTAGHPIFSLDRGDYVPLGDLQPDEHVRTADGWAIVESLARWWGCETVHNLEVDAEHRYFVGAERIESHNAGGCNGALRGADGRFAPNPATLARNNGNGVHGNTAGNQYAERYELYDKNGIFQKNGVSQNANTRYSKAELAGGRVRVVETGPRRQMLDNERFATETNPGPLNREPWAGTRKPK